MSYVYGIYHAYLSRQVMLIQDICTLVSKSLILQNNIITLNLYRYINN